VTTPILEVLDKQRSSSEGAISVIAAVQRLRRRPRPFEVFLEKGVQMITG
jgi:hypothetical protein